MPVPIGSDGSLRRSGDWSECVAKRVKPLIQLLTKQTMEHRYRDKVKAVWGE